MIQKAMLGMLAVTTLGIALLWAASLTTTVLLEHTAPDNRYRVRLSVAARWVLVEVSRRGKCGGCGRYADSENEHREDCWIRRIIAIGGYVDPHLPSTTVFSVPGLQVARDRATGWREQVVTVHLGVPFVLSACYPTIAFIRGPLRRHRRRKRGLCVHCGYNLTGLTEARCPECGVPVKLNGD